MGKNLQKLKSYTVDLARISGNGDFSCPRCGVKISPDDQTDEIYTVLETTVKGEDLETITLLCNNCGSQIQLIGFQLLNTAK